MSAFTLWWCVPQEKITKGKYKKAATGNYVSGKGLFDHIERVLQNAVLWNADKRDNKAWHDEAKRLLGILKPLRDHKVVKHEWIAAPEVAPNLRECPQCNCMMHSHPSSQAKRCGGCQRNIRSPKPVFTCHNHKDGAHTFCDKCAKKQCMRCHKWHQGKCSQKKRSPPKARMATSDGYQLDAINLNIPRRPDNVRAVSKFEMVRMVPVMASKIELIIKQIKVWYLASSRLAVSVLAD